MEAGEADKPLDLIKSNGVYVGHKGPAFGTRHVQVALLSSCLLIGIATKASFAVQIVAMTKPSSPNPAIPIYNWTNTSIILSSFFWTYVISNIIAAPLEKTFGPKWFLLAAIFVNSTAYICIPLAAYIGSYGVLLCRLLQGFGQGFLFPTQQVILGSWAPTEERSRAGIAVNTGNTVGMMLASLVPGYLAASWWGWPVSFYLIGCAGLLWCLLYLVLGENSPETHPGISAEERRYIQTSLNQQKMVNIPIPYRKMVMSRPIWAVSVAQIGVAWSNNMVVTEYASYLDKAMGFDIKSNGLYMAVPPVAALLMGFLFGPVSDYVIKTSLLSTVNCRRLFHLTGGAGITLSVTLLSYLHQTQKLLAIMLITGIYISQSAMVCGSVINMIDLSPRFAGIIFGISNAAGQSIALFAPLLVQFIVTNPSDVTQWRTVFCITGATITVTSIFFAIFASGDRQMWDGPAQKDRMVERFQRISLVSIAATLP